MGPKKNEITPIDKIYKRCEVVGRGKFGVVYKGYVFHTCV